MPTALGRAVSCTRIILSRSASCAHSCARIGPASSSAGRLPCPGESDRRALRRARLVPAGRRSVRQLRVRAESRAARRRLLAVELQLPVVLQRDGERTVPERPSGARDRHVDGHVGRRHARRAGRRGGHRRLRASVQSRGAVGRHLQRSHRRSSRPAGHLRRRGDTRSTLTGNCPDGAGTTPSRRASAHGRSPVIASLFLASPTTKSRCEAANSGAPSEAKCGTERGEITKGTDNVLVSNSLQNST